MDVIYLDFCKAFDKVPHQRLLLKLKSYGITGNLYNWIQDFLIGRTQRVVLNGKMSEWRNVNSGIPQGSVLGPILFLVYINDFPDCTTCLIKLFAADSKLYSKVNTPHKPNLYNKIYFSQKTGQINGKCSSMRKYVNNYT